MRLNKTIIPYLVISVISLAFFVVGLLTIPHYGINWDEPFHFQRGQAYLHYFFTGKKDYLDLPAYPLLRGTSDFVDRAGISPLYKNAQHGEKPVEQNFKRSYYQSDVFSGKLLETFDGGHPPVSDILASLFNYVLYQKLSVAGDIESYHIYEVLMASFTVLVVGLFSYRFYGLIPAIFASLAISLYPLFFAESHFNIKDPTQTAFFTLTIWVFYLGVVNKNWKLILTASILAGLALGTKFNIIFLPLIIIPWFIMYIFNTKTQIKKWFLLSIIGGFLITIGLFILSWPFLWTDTINHFLKVISYYREIGSGVPPEMEEYRFGILNSYPVLWILYTTPLPILVLAILGTVYSVICLLKKNDHNAFLILLWFLIPILRVSLFNANIYGGVRQIMEFIPALALLSAAGVTLLMKLHFIFPRIYQKTWGLVLGVMLLVAFVSVARELAMIHPNENVYFNQLIGGLSGAKEKNIPSWGNTYGNVYLQGVQWINNNAQKDAKLGLPIATMVNVPRIQLRSDIYFSNQYPSGPARQGEYVMEVAHDWSPKKWYGFSYYDTFLEPVYEVKVDSVPLLKIWKNDLNHTKPEFKGEQEYKIDNFKLSGNVLNIDFGEERLLTRLIIKHDSNNCQDKQVGGYIRISTDGKVWLQEQETIDYPQIPVQWLGSDQQTFVYLFTAEKARFILLDTQINESCILKNPTIQIFGLTMEKMQNKE